jgi:molybdopterin-containing oxidoreductase family membrane subunit
MWFERFVIIVISLHRDFLPASWGYFTPSWVDICTYIGTFGLFFTMFLLFIRFLPMIAIWEVKHTTPQANPRHRKGGQP